MCVRLQIAMPTDSASHRPHKTIRDANAMTLLTFAPCININLIIIYLLNAKIKSNSKRKKKTQQQQQQNRLELVFGIRFERDCRMYGVLAATDHFTSRARHTYM